MRVFESLADQGQTVIMVTHEPDIAAHARRVVVLRDGLIATDDSDAQRSSEKHGLSRRRRSSRSRASSRSSLARHAASSKPSASR